jgi:hypothetical protein
MKEQGSLSLSAQRARKVIFLLTPRCEVAQLAESLFRPLFERGISLLPLLTETGVVGDLKKVESMFRSSGITFKELSDLYQYTALEILLKEKPGLLLTDNDLIDVHYAFVLSGHYLHIPTLVIRESTYELSGDDLNPRWILSEILAKLNHLPRFLEKYLFYIRSMASTKPDSLASPCQLIKVLLRGSQPARVVGQFSDYILANTPEDAEFLSKRCGRALFVRTVGSPRYDETLNLQPTEASEVRREIQQLFRIPPNKAIILFLSGSQVEHGMWTEKQRRAVNAQILDSLRMFSEQAHVVIKLHPIERNAFPIIWRADYDKFMSITDSGLSKLIHASDIVITWFSTAMLNVVLAKKPLVVMDFLNGRRYGILRETQSIIEHGAAIEVTDTEQLRKAISAFMRDKKLAQSLERSQEIFRRSYLGTVDGGSINRIAETVLEVLNTNPARSVGRPSDTL